MPEPVYKANGDCWKLKVWAQPGAKRSELAGIYQGCLKVRLSAPAVDNKANKALVKYVAGQLGVKPRQVTLADGHTSRRKTLVIESSIEPRWENVLPKAAVDR